MRLTRCRLRHCRCLRYSASVKLLEPCKLMRHSWKTLLTRYLLCRFWLALVSRLQSVLLSTKSAKSEDRNHDLKIMWLTLCRLRHCRCLHYVASLKLLEPFPLMPHSWITLLSGYILCCFWLALVFRIQYVIPWQKVRQLRMELAALRLWDLSAADCAIVAVPVMVHQWIYWRFLRWCGIPE